jgi:hypothetical protein
MLLYAKNIFTQHSWIRFNIDKKIIEYRDYCIDFDYGNLRKITSEDLNKNVM